MRAKGCLCMNICIYTCVHVFVHSCAWFYEEETTVTPTYIWSFVFFLIIENRLAENESMITCSDIALVFFFALSVGNKLTKDFNK